VKRQDGKVALAFDWDNRILEVGDIVEGDRYSNHVYYPGRVQKIDELAREIVILSSLTKETIAKGSGLRSSTSLCLWIRRTSTRIREGRLDLYGRRRRGERTRMKMKRLFVFRRNIDQTPNKSTQLRIALQISKWIARRGHFSDSNDGDSRRKNKQLKILSRGSSVKWKKKSAVSPENLKPSKKGKKDMALVASSYSIDDVPDGEFFCSRDCNIASTKEP